jgi:phosphotransferase system HPr (HPr) family protein
VVEDNADSAECLRILLKLSSHDVRVARDGYQAIDAALRWRPEFILLDLGLPGMDGYQVADRLRSEESCHRATIIAVTGYGQRKDQEYSRAQGIENHLVKPVAFEYLLSLISPAEAARRRNAADGPVSAAVEPPPEVVSERSYGAVSRHADLANARGMHLRAADRFVRLARKFRAEVRATCDGRTVSGRSVLDLLTLAAPCGARMEVEADGPDAEAALDALTALIDRGFDEADG